MEETMLLAAKDGAQRILEGDGFEVVDGARRDPEEGPSFLVAINHDRTVVRLVTLVTLGEGEVPDLEALRPEAELAMLDWFVGHELEEDVRVFFDLSMARLAPTDEKAIMVRYAYDAFGTNPVRA